MKVGEVSRDEIGLLMGGVHGTAEEVHIAARSARCRSGLRSAPSPRGSCSIVTPIAAVLLTMLVGGIIFSLIGYDGLGAVREIFIDAAGHALQVAGPRGQGVAADHHRGRPLDRLPRQCLEHRRRGAVHPRRPRRRPGVALLTDDMSGPWILPLMMVAGMLGGAACAAIPALLRTRFTSTRS